MCHTASVSTSATGRLHADGSKSYRDALIQSCGSKRLLVYQPLILRILTACYHNILVPPRTLNTHLPVACDVFHAVTLFLQPISELVLQPAKLTLLDGRSHSRYLLTSVERRFVQCLDGSRLSQLRTWLLFLRLRMLLRVSYLELEAVSLTPNVCDLQSYRLMMILPPTSRS